jgi:hypothetical protein
MRNDWKVEIPLRSLFQDSDLRVCQINSSREFTEDHTHLQSIHSLILKHCLYLVTNLHPRLHQDQNQNHNHTMAEQNSSASKPDIQYGGHDRFVLELEVSRSNTITIS